MENEIKREAICKYLSIVGNALDAILLAERTRDGRKRDKEIRKAKEEAQNMVYSYKDDLADICNLESLGSELFDWGHLKGDLQDVYAKLKELSSQHGQ